MALKCSWTVLRAVVVLRPTTPLTCMLLHAFAPIKPPQQPACCWRVCCTRTASACAHHKRICARWLSWHLFQYPTADMLPGTACSAPGVCIDTTDHLSHALSVLAPTTQPHTCMLWGCQQHTHMHMCTLTRPSHERRTGFAGPHTHHPNRTHAAGVSAACAVLAHAPSTSYVSKTKRPRGGCVHLRQIPLRPHAARSAARALAVCMHPAGHHMRGALAFLASMPTNPMHTALK